MPKRRPFLPKDLLHRILVADVAVSPDGDSLVFVRQTVVDGKECSRLWRMGFDGSAAVPLTSDDSNATGPRFSPDGATLAFLSDRGSKPDEEVSQPWRLPLAGGEPEPFPTLPEGADDLSWSPQGDALVCVGSSGTSRFDVGPKADPTARVIRVPHMFADRQGLRDPLTCAWLVPQRGKASRLTDAAHEVTQAFWSPDGQRVGFVADRASEPGPWEAARLWSVSRGGGDPASLSAFDGCALTAAWGPNKIAFMGTTQSYPAFHTVGVFIADNEGTRQLAAERDIFFGAYGWSETLPLRDLGPLWIDDDTFLVFACVQGRSMAFRVGADEVPVALFRDDMTVDIAAAATDGGRVAVIASVDAGAGEIYELDLEGGGLRQVTRQAQRWFAPFHRPAKEIVVRHPEGHDIQGWVTMATGAETECRPLVLEIHGGPYDLTKPAPIAEMLMLADAGFHVAAMNPRGSIGFGEAFAGALFGQWGVPDASDLLATVDHLVAEGLVDPERVGVLGLSYGGFMVNHLLGAYPGRFRVGVSENPFTEAIADIGAGDSGMTMEPETGVGTLQDDLEGWLALSPALRIHRNEAPLLLLQAEDDLRCPPVHSQIVFQILHALGRTVELVRYPGEYHGMMLSGRPDRRIDRLERILDWFGRYL